MPVKSNTNNRVLPANARNADVAERAIREITPVFQQRYYAAFRVQGFQSILYNKLRAGKPCSCQAAHKVLNTRLGEDGKASEGTINEMLTGAVFNISGYGDTGRVPDDPYGFSVTSPNAPVNKHQGQFDVRGSEFSETVNHTAPGFGDNGPSDYDLESLVTNFDTSVTGYSDVKCGICYGSGFVGAYAPFHAHRDIVAASDVAMDDGDIDLQASPFVATTQAFEFQAILPRGAISIDAFRVMLNFEVVSANFIVDGTKVTSTGTILSKCDGMLHRIRVEFPEEREFTHVELQFNLTEESAYFEFPKLSKSSDLSKLNTTDPFTILMSPNIPAVHVEDIVVESVQGYHLVVQNVSPWNSRDRSVLGWECTVRVAQPQEWLTRLPTRGRVPTKNQTTNAVVDNITGRRRT